MLCGGGYLGFKYDNVYLSYRWTSSYDDMGMGYC